MINELWNSAVRFLWPCPCVIDWQAVTTFLTGLALAIFAWKTWRLEVRQNKLLYQPSLALYPITSYPSVKLYHSEANNYQYDGVYWEVKLAGC